MKQESAQIMAPDSTVEIINTYIVCNVSEYTMHIAVIRGKVV